jgi:hypothetical protein
MIKFQPVNHVFLCSEFYGHAFCDDAKCSLANNKCNTTCLRSLSSDEVATAWRKAGGDFMAYIEVRIMIWVFLCCVLSPVFCTFRNSFQFTQPSVSAALLLISCLVVVLLFCRPIGSTCWMAQSCSSPRLWMESRFRCKSLLLYRLASLIPAYQFWRAQTLKMVTINWH